MSETTERSASAPYRIKDLVERTGVSKETIHFYITEGLLPKAHKTARNMAWYGEEHVERLRTIKELQEKQFLPLKAIKAVLGDAADHAFTPDQQRTIATLQARLAARQGGGEQRFVGYRDLLARYGMEPWELDELEAAGAITVDRGRRGPRVDAEDEDIVRVFAALRDIGFSPERGFGPRDIQLFEQFISILFTEEVKLLTGRVPPHDADDAARMVEQGLPRINEMLGLLHARRVRKFLSEYNAAK